jgi:hypothetical protein
MKQVLQNLRNGETKVSLHRKFVKVTKMSCAIVVEVIHNGK